MDFNNNKNDKNKFRSKSLANNFLVNLSKTTEKRSSNIFSSISKKTPGFNDRFQSFHRTSKRLLSQKTKNEEFIKLRNSTNNQIQMNKSQEISMQYIQDKNDINVNCTNINISIVNPNFSINNFEPRHSATNTNNNKININVINNSLLSFNDNDNKIEKNETKTKTDDGKIKILSSIYKDYLENKSQDESFFPNFDEDQKKKFKKYLINNKIVQHEFKTQGIISGFSAYMYQNEEVINKDKICLNINIDKLNIDKNTKNKKEVNKENNLINYFSLFCGGKNDQNDELPKMLKNKLKDMILNNKDIIKNPEYAIKKGLFNAEIEFINNFMEEKINEPSNFFKALQEKQHVIPHCSILVLINMDDNFYIGNVGKITTILSSNYSQKINYLSKELIFQSQNEDEHEKRNKKSPLKNNNFFDDNTKKDIEDNNNIIDASNNNILMDKSNSSILNNSIANKIFPKLNIKRIFPGNTIYRIINKRNLFNYSNNDQITSFEIYDKYKRRSSATIINLINVINQQKIKSSKLSNHINDSYNNSKKGCSNSTKFLHNIIRGKNLIKQNLNESNSDKKIISSYPDTLSFKYQKEHDFILICSKKIIDSINYSSICKGVYETMKNCIRKERSFEIFLGCVVKDIIKKAISLGITTNISCIFICFESIKNLYLKHDINVVENELVSFYLTSSYQKRFELYKNLLHFDLVDIDKCYKYDNRIKNEIDRLGKKKKSVLSAHNIKESKKVLFNNYVNDTNKTINIKLKEEEQEIKKKKKCCCINF